MHPRWMTLILAWAMPGCAGEEDRRLPSEAEAEAEAESEAEAGGEAVAVTLAVMGMDCPGCAQEVDIALERLDGVVEATVTLSPPEADVGYFPDRVSPSDMIEAIRDIGYDAEVASP